MVYMYGKVEDAVSGKPLVGADIQVWEASTNGEFVLLLEIWVDQGLEEMP